MAGARPAASLRPRPLVGRAASERGLRAVLSTSYAPGSESWSGAQSAVSRCGAHRHEPEESAWYMSLEQRLSRYLQASSSSICPRSWTAAGTRLSGRSGTCSASRRTSSRKVMIGLPQSFGTVDGMTATGSKPTCTMSTTTAGRELFCYPKTRATATPCRHFRTSSEPGAKGWRRRRRLARTSGASFKRVWRSSPRPCSARTRTTGSCSNG